MRRSLRTWRNLISARGSVYMEYCLLTSVVFLTAAAVFAPGSWVYRALGADFELREVLLRLPIF